ncbi:MAG: DNA polymerase II large subunit, partial [Candidatus Diapherotrites archaeon]|nr:DNA polymerase II large subunit [Candidatus Diapherotrites archaeon]
AKAINPAGMIMFDEFIAVGTHGKIERPGKATQFFPCNTIDGPIVMLNDGEVLRVNSVEKAEAIKANLEKIIYIGDLLASYGDFRKSAHPLIPPGYCEEWWGLELEEIVKKKTNALKELKLEKVLKNPLEVGEEEALLISKKLGIALHPKYLHYYKALNGKEIIMLHNFLLSAKFEDGKIVLEKDFEAKIFLERIGLPHKIEKETIVIDEFAKSIEETFSLKEKKTSKKEDPLEYLSEISGMMIRDKGGSFIGARMGRPEQAKRREMKGNPHVLFPIGLSGGSTKSINRAVDMNNNEKGKIEIELAEYFCKKCKKKIHFASCPECGERTKLLKFCRECKESFAAENCPKCGKETVSYGRHEIDLRTELANAKSNLRVPLPSLIKGVKGMISDAKEVEPLEKGILRARHNVHIFRDGTSRYELLNATITHFKPKEINMSVEKAKELGYEKDYLGAMLEFDEQLLEIFPQDIIVNDDCGGWMLEVSKFVDDELEKFYGKKPFYNAKTKEDLIGALLLGLAPHTSAAVTSRVIGYTKARLGFGHPFWVCAKRRNVDGDQDSVLMLMDGLLNFSLKYLANRNGGKMDAPVVFSTIVNPREVDDEVYNMEICSRYPLSFYQKASGICEPFIDDIKIVDNVIDTKEQYTNIGFTHDTEIFDEGPKKSMYVQLKSMEDKITSQNKLQKKIMAVDAKDCLERVMGSHFMPDIIGNARAFSRQSFRCTHCNEKYRRIPLSGKCYKCGRDKVILTIHQGSVRKYLKIAQNLARQEHLSDYLIQRLDMIEKEIDSVFMNEKITQKGLFDFV